MAEKQQRTLAHKLAERVKELNALHQTARILHERSDPADLLRKVVELLPPAWQYPEVAAARITFAGLEACTAWFATSPWLQRADFATEAGERGCIEVVYRKSCPPEVEGPFLAEERRLINSLADLLSTYFERIRAEEDRMRLARAEAAQREAQETNRAKDEFLAMVSHELRSPLHVMLGWTKILRSKEPNAQISRGLDILERNIKLQARLIDDLLDVSRIIAGKLRLDVRPLDLAMLASFAADESRPAADAKHIKLTAHLESVGLVSADPQRLQQVIFNLLTNAVKFTPEDGRIDIRLERVDNGARLSVADTGIGIANDLLPHVFDRFRQGSSSTAKHNGGLGLGLAIARHLVEMHQGTLSVASEGCGTGATFHMTLPVMPCVAAEPGG
ncbi:MAG: HAMP domain-containing sensor histidine kinase [Steroidobacteraceae bacterium]